MYKYTNIDTIDFQLSCVRCSASIIFGHASVETLVVMLHLFYHQHTHPVDMILKGNEFFDPTEAFYRLRARHADGRAWSGSGQQLKQRLSSKLFLQGGKVVSLRVPGTTQRPARKGSAFKLVLAGHAGV